jgi:hypothetical protein
MSLVPLLNPKFAIELPARLCELRVRGTSLFWTFTMSNSKAGHARIAQPTDVRPPKRTHAQALNEFGRLDSSSLLGHLALSPVAEGFGPAAG